MPDLFGTKLAPVPLPVQIACIEREIAMRKRVYPAWVASGRMSQAKTDAELLAMRAVLETLQGVRDA
jgi:hypothetical protein